MFDDKWDCVGLHHAGGKRIPSKGLFGIPKLNGKNTLCEANQGIWIGSIHDDVKVRKLTLD